MTLSAAPLWKQATDIDDMRLYKDVLTFEENLQAGLTRSPKIYLSTQDGAGNWSDELEIDALNPAPDVPPMSYFNGYDMVQFNFTKPDDTDWAGFCVWADTQTPVRKDQITSKYIGPNNEVSLSLLSDTDYYITYTGTNNDEDNTAIKNFVDANFFGINPKN